ncbi:MAG: agmatinase [Pseudohongiellaceae bacterium]
MASWDDAFRGTAGQGLSHTLSFGGAGSFFRVPYSRDLSSIDLAVTGIPLDIATTNRPGARLGPRAIRQASLSLSWARPWPWSVDAMEALRIVDYGDCEPPGDNLLSVAHIEEHVTSILEAGTAVLSLGGDHFIAYPCVRAHAAVHGPLCLVHFDAHTDTWPSSGDGVNHGTMFHQAAREGLVLPEHSTQIGIRTTNDDTMGYRTVTAPEVHQRSAQDIAAEVLERAGGRPVYMTFDIDCLDPAFAPGTGTPVPGGLSTFQALEIIRALRGIQLVGMDIVEVSPSYDHAEITALAAAQISIEMLSLYADGKAPATGG